MRFDTLQDWLGWQETLHPVDIELGLERVAEVAARLQLLHPPCPVITVAGTNGKGSSVAMLASIYRAAGYRVGAYTSPHIHRYNERVRLDGRPVSDAALVRAFEQVDQARGDTSLTYFEFGTLAAMQVFGTAEPDVILLEVGLGGRLDAVNVWDADAALVTAVDLDHMAWLGDSREQIGREKAGIFRGARPAICSDPRPPASVAEVAAAVAARWYPLGDAFGFRREDVGWSWWAGDARFPGLPVPALPGEHQLQNAAGVLMVIESLRERLPVERTAIDRGLLTVRLPGRQEWRTGPVDQVLDVSHNAHGSTALATTLAARPVKGRTRLVLAMLADKDPAAFAAPLQGEIDGWYLAGLDTDRGLSGGALDAALAGLLADRPRQVFASVQEAYLTAMADSIDGDRVVVAGSFLTVAAMPAAEGEDEWINW